ncbi:MAG: MlaD family protein [Phocaeicola sp.]
MRKEFKIGVIGIAAVAILIFGINYLKGVQMFQPSNVYYVEYSDVNGLAKSSPIFVNGFKIGLVRNIEYNYNKPGHVTVEIEIDDEMRIPKGSKGVLEAEMLGGVKMHLIFSDETTNFYTPKDTLAGAIDAGLIGAAQESILPKVDALLPKADSLLQSINALLGNPAIAAILKNTEDLTKNLKTTTTQLNNLLHNDLPQITSNLIVVTDNFQTISENLKVVDYASLFNKIDSTLYNVHLLTEKLNRKDNSFGLLLNDPGLYQNVEAATANAASLLQDLQTNPKRYVHFSLFGKKAK